MRKVTIHLDSEFFDAVETAKVPRQSWHAAVGYLACWSVGSERYKDVTIYGNYDGSISATYRDTKGDITFEIGAVLGTDKTYSFHS